MADLTKTYLFRMTHIANVPHILQYGITHRNSPSANLNFVPIGDGSLILSRNDFLLYSGKRLGEYIPFYFCGRTPMLYVIQHGFNMVKPTLPVDIVYCVSTVQKILEQDLPFIFTDGHAIDGFSTQYDNQHIGKIDSIIDWGAVNAKYWIDENDLDKKRRKEAEFLVFGDIEPNAIIGYIVFNDEARNRLLQAGVGSDKIRVNASFYF